MNQPVVSKRRRRLFSIRFVTFFFHFETTGELTKMALLAKKIKLCRSWQKNYEIWKIDSLIIVASGIVVDKLVFIIIMSVQEH